MKRSTQSRLPHKGQEGKSMSDDNKYQRFLEPVYLNERMVLNCAAYLFKGVPIDSQSSETSKSARDVNVSVGFPFLSEFLNIGGGGSAASVVESNSRRLFTAGGLHMEVLDELHNRKMIKNLSAINFSASSSISEAYVDMHTVLLPSDYNVLMNTLKSITPLVSQLIQDFGEHLPHEVFKGKLTNGEEFHRAVSVYRDSIVDLIENLESDYLTSNQLEMIMWTEGTSRTPIGIVELDVSDIPPSQLRSKLSGGKYHVIGKVVGRVERGQSMSLMQKSVLSNLAELVKRIMDMSPNEAEREKLVPLFLQIRQVVEKFVRLEIPGPAIRITAMSVCI